VPAGIKKFAPATFGLALLCFFLPFISVSCQTQRIVTFTGIQLVTGATVELPQIFGPPKSEKLPREPLAVLAFACGVVGLGLSFLKGRKIAIAPAVVGCAGAVTLLLLKSKLDADVLKGGNGVLHVDYEVGFWLILLSYAAAAGLNLVFFLQSGKEPLQMQMGPSSRTPAEAPPAPTPSTPARTAVQAAAASAAAGVRSYGNLQCVAGPLAGRRFAVTRQGLLIGRDPAKCQIVLPEEGVSREHAWVVATDEGVLVIDRGSSNGTYVNSVEAGRVIKAQLRDGDRVLIGPRGAIFTYSRD
jgi:FHA domain